MVGAVEFSLPGMHEVYHVFWNLPEKKEPALAICEGGERTDLIFSFFLSFSLPFEK